MLTACTSPYASYNLGQVIKYQRIRASTGISNTTRFLSSGVFICEKPGLYIIMVSMRGRSSDNYYYIKKNNTYMLFIQNIHSNDGVERSVSGSFAIDLDIGDSIYVISFTSVRLIDYACLSVIKIK